MLRTLVMSLMYLALPIAAVAGPVDQARFTVGMPVYVYHPDERSGPKDWNQGWFHNEGLLSDVSWPMYKPGNDTALRAGFTAGGFDNSVRHLSIFLGGMAEIETFVTERLAFNLGTYVGAISGYDDGVDPAIAPYAGTSYAVSDTMEVGLRGYWMPARTIAGRAFADSDAYVGTVNVGTRF